MRSCDVPPIGAEKSGPVMRRIKEDRVGLSQIVRGPIAHTPYANSVIIRGGDEVSAIWRKAEGVDDTNMTFESILHVSLLYFPELE